MERNPGGHLEQRDFIRPAPLNRSPPCPDIGAGFSLPLADGPFLTLRGLRKTNCPAWAGHVAMVIMSSGQAHGASGAPEGPAFRLSTMRKKILSATPDKKFAPAACRFVRKFCPFVFFTQISQVSCCCVFIRVP